MRAFVNFLGEVGVAEDVFEAEEFAAKIDGARRGGGVGENAGFGVVGFFVFHGCWVWVSVEFQPMSLLRRVR